MSTPPPSLPEDGTGQVPAGAGGRAQVQVEAASPVNVCVQDLGGPSSGLPYSQGAEAAGGQEG